MLQNMVIPKEFAAKFPVFLPLGGKNGCLSRQGEARRGVAFSNATPRSHYRRGENTVIQSSIRKKDETIVFEINGEIVSPYAYMTYFTEKAAYDDFSAAGVTLFSVPVFFSSCTIQERGPIPAFSKGIFDEETPDYTIADRLFKEILDKCPQAYIFPRVNLSLPYRWEKENPDELCDTAFTQNRRPCFSSDKWAEETKRLLGLLIDHIENSSYRDRVCGYQLAGGNTEEWFSFDQNGSVGKRSREKFAQRMAAMGKSGDDAEYYAYLSQITAERICEFADYAKEKTQHRLVVGAFYGYTFETPDRTSCHHALETVLRSDSVDFLCSPVSYMENRKAGIDHPYMLPLDSLKLHGKLYFSENDTRTHLTVPPYDIPHFNRPVWMPREKWLSVENMKQHFARAITHGHGLWWFDMWGGWYRYPLYMEMIREFGEIMANAVNGEMKSVSEVAVLADESAFCQIDNDDGAAVCSRIRHTLGLMGTPYDSYLASDYDEIRGRYKALILLAPRMTPILKRIAEENPACLIITVENCAITSAELREYCRSRGVHIYSNRDAVVYVNNRYLFLHTASVGKAELSLPEGWKLTQIAGDCVELGTTVLPSCTGYLFAVRKDGKTS